jgi:hypothetical protein
MSIRPTSEAWKRRFGACLAAALAALLFTGARQVTQELRHHDERLDQVHLQLAEWSRHLAGPPALGGHQDIVGDHALFLVRLCCLPLRQP